MKIGRPLIKLSTVASTNQYAASLIHKKKAVNGTAIIAREQTEGKGQNQSYWESKPGENLTISILVQPNGLLPARQFLLNKITSLALRDFVLSQLKHENLEIKWPNDIYIGNKKVAGILISNIIDGQTISWSVIGIGININQTVFESDAPNPISLKQISGKKYKLDVCFRSLCDAFELRFKQLLGKKYQDIDADYLDALYRFGILSSFIYKNQKIQAKITGIGDFGHLEIESINGESLLCDLKEIKFIP